jgi:indolepyruvate ferredoxin oxidoreductase
MSAVATPEPLPLNSITLKDKYDLDEGRIFLTGIQALVRMVFDQHRADAAAGLKTGTMISGYQGSPLGAFDLELLRQRDLCSNHDVVFHAALNEELGATTVWGSQLAPQLNNATFDGVVGIWYGKNPGLDRAADAIRHANFCGTPRTGGAVALVGDDPSCKSSTLPSASEPMCASLLMPVLWPGSVQEVLDLGRHAISLSRASGLWAALKIVTNVADAAATAEVSAERIQPVIPEVEWYGKPYVHKPNGTMLAPDSLISERSLLNVRLEIAKAYARMNRLNTVTVPTGDAWLGIASSGKTYYDLMQALRDLGLDEAELDRRGVRVFKISMPWPLERELVREFATGLEEILVVEDKLPFLETQFKEHLYGIEEAPRIVGKRDEEDGLLLPAEGELDADLIARAVSLRFEHKRLQIDSVRARMQEIELAQRAKFVPLPVVRTPFFCSGCPHNSSTVAEDDQLVGAGIGCHTMILLNREGRGQITGITQMGGEGAQWIGIAPWVSDRHFVQNLGDGTFHHSGSLAVRAATAANSNITYKLFYNSFVAMTGGQKVEGGMTVPELTRWFAIEGVKQVVVTSDDPDKYRGVELDPIASVRPREHMMDVQRELAQVEGVTVLIHDQVCAAENRRMRKRGKAVDPPQRIFINERVCEGCGDCGVKSSCLSVLPVETEFGRKTQIHQPSCNKDYSCLQGDCPSFLTVIPATKAKGKGVDVGKPKAAWPEPPPLPEPDMLVDDTDYVVRMIGIGGTGVVTVSQILSMAAHVEGKHTSGLDQTGLSQKGGPVISDIRISRDEITGSNKASTARVDLYLGFDLLGAANPKNLQTADPKRTIAVVSTSVVPTGKMVVDVDSRFPEIADALDAIDAQTRGKDLNVFIDAQALSERLFDDHLPANTVALGAACQRGAIPVSPQAIEEAIRLNGAGVEKNLAAFRWGRACVAVPDAVAALEVGAVAEGQEFVLPEKAAKIVEGIGVTAGSELERVLGVRVTELIAYQNAKYAQRYADFVRDEALPHGEDIAEVVARELYNFMAYKDEYEVARLHLLDLERLKRDEAFGKGAKVWFMLHPPLLRALGMKKKLKLGRWFVPFFKMLRASKGLRGHWYDPFTHNEVRRCERKLIGEYETLVRDTLAALDDRNRKIVVEMLCASDLVRGYEDIKLRNVERWHARLEELRPGLADPDAVTERPDTASPILPITAIR